MRNFLFATFAAALAVPAAAQTTPTSVAASSMVETGTTLAVKRNAMVMSADGRRLGRVSEIRNVNGAPAFATLIYNGKFINVPVSSLTAKDGGFVTTMAAADFIRR